jgi:hypothetical protein
LTLRDPSCAEWDKTQSASGTFWREAPFPTSNDEQLVCSMKGPGGRTLIEVRDTGEHFAGNRVCASLTSEAWHDAEGPGAKIEQSRKGREAEQAAKVQQRQEQERAKTNKQEAEERSQEERKREAENKKQEREYKKQEAEQHSEVERQERENKAQERKNEEETNKLNAKAGSNPSLGRPETRPFRAGSSPTSRFALVFASPATGRWRPHPHVQPVKAAVCPCRWLPPCLAGRRALAQLLSSGSDPRLFRFT